MPARPNCCAVAGVTCSTRKLPPPSYCSVRYSKELPARVREVCPAALAIGYRIRPPLVPLTWIASPLPLSVAKPIDQPDGSPVVDGKVTVSPALVLKLDRTVPLS